MCSSRPGRCVPLRSIPLAAIGAILVSRPYDKASNDSRQMHGIHEAEVFIAGAIKINYMQNSCTSVSKTLSHGYRVIAIDCEAIKATLFKSNTFAF